MSFTASPLIAMELAEKLVAWSLMTKKPTLVTYVLYQLLSKYELVTTFIIWIFYLWDLLAVQRWSLVASHFRNITLMPWREPEWLYLHLERVHHTPKKSTYNRAWIKIISTLPSHLITKCSNAINFLPEQ